MMETKAKDVDDDHSKQHGEVEKKQFIKRAQNQRGDSESLQQAERFQLTAMPPVDEKLIGTHSEQ